MKYQMLLRSDIHHFKHISVST